MRYQKADEATEEFIFDIRKECFPEIEDCTVMVLMDTKKRKKKGTYVFASIRKPADIEKFLSADDYVTEGYDYIIFIDKNIWDNIDQYDRKRIVRHEWRHVYYDDEKKDPWKLIDHDIQDFREEQRLNSDDPDWDLKVLEIAKTVYEE